jgi:hypothetical protein
MKSEKQLIQKVIQDMKTKGYALKTQQTYIKWIKEYISFHQQQNPIKLGIREIEHFKKALDLKRLFSNEIKKEASRAIVFLYTQVLGINLQHEYIKATRNLENIKTKKVQRVMVF